MRKEAINNEPILLQKETNKINKFTLPHSKIICVNPYTKKYH